MYSTAHQAAGVVPRAGRHGGCRPRLVPWRLLGWVPLCKAIFFVRIWRAVTSLSGPVLQDCSEYHPGVVFRSALRNPDSGAVVRGRPCREGRGQ